MQVEIKRLELEAKLVEVEFTRQNELIVYHEGEVLVVIKIPPGGRFNLIFDSFHMAVLQRNSDHLQLSFSAL